MTPRGVTVNNPFDLEYNHAINHPGQLPPLPGSPFARYDTPAHGIHAGLADVRAKIARGLNTPNKMIPVFAPPFVLRNGVQVKENDTLGYINHMCDGFGIGPDDVIDLSTAEACERWARVQIDMEVGHAPDGEDWYTDEQYQEAIAPFFAGPAT